MKLYVFDLNNYGNYYSVMEESPEAALEALKAHRHWEWKDATLDNLPEYYPGGARYTIKEYDCGEVIEHVRD
jgi:hypothetical protein